MPNDATSCPSGRKHSPGLPDIEPLKTFPKRPRCYRLRRQQTCPRLLHATSRVTILYFMLAHTSFPAARQPFRCACTDQSTQPRAYIPKSSKAPQLPECRYHGHICLSRGPQFSRASTTEEPNPWCVHVRRLQTSPSGGERLAVLLTGVSSLLSDGLGRRSSG